MGGRRAAALWPVATTTASEDQVPSVVTVRYPSSVRHTESTSVCVRTGAGAA